MIDCPELPVNVLSGPVLWGVYLFNGTNIAEFDLLQGITQGLKLIQFEIAVCLVLLIWFGEELEEFDEDLDVINDEESFLIYEISMNVLSCVAKSFTQLFIKACRLEIRNLQYRLRNSQEMVFRDVSGQLFSFNCLIY